MKKILILYTRAGGGHQSAARAIATELESQFQCQTELFDPLEGQQILFVDNLLEKVYVLLTEKLPLVWALGTILLKLHPIQQLAQSMFALSTRSAVASKIQDYQPSAVISTYFFFDSIVSGIADQYKLKLPVLTLVSEIFEAPPVWFTHRQGLYAVFSPRALDLAVNKYKISADNVIANGFFINKRFYERLSDQKIKKIKQDMQIDPQLPVVLLIGGGAGLPKGYRILRQILRQNLACHLIVVCGRNQKLYNQCANLVSTQDSSRVRVTLLGFSDRVYELMNLADLIVTKAGPAIVLETLSLGKIPLLCHYIWEQEKGNRDFVVNNNLGIYEPNSEKLVAKLSELLSSRNLRQQYEQRIEKMNIRSDISLAAEKIYTRLLDSKRLS